MVKRIDQAVAEIGSGAFFMKLSTRSPKDSKILRDRGELIEEHKGTEGKEAQLMKDIHALKVNSTFEALDLFCLS